MVGQKGGWLLVYPSWCASPLCKPSQEEEGLLFHDKKQSALSGMLWEYSVEQGERVASWDTRFCYLASQLQSMHFLSHYPVAMLYMIAAFKFFCVANQYTPNRCKLKITFKKVICNSDHFRELIYSVATKSVVQVLLNGQ